MKLLEECYEEVIINETLQLKNINPKVIESILNKQYAEYKTRNLAHGKIPVEKEGNFLPQKDEVKHISEVLVGLLDLEKSNYAAFKKFKDKPSELGKYIHFKEQALHRYLNTAVPKSFLQKQPVYLTIIEILNKAFLPIAQIPVTKTQGAHVQGDNPIYPYHLIPRYLLMNLVEEAFIKKQISEEHRNQIKDIIFNEAMKNMIGQEMEQFAKSSKHSPSTPKEEDTSVKSAHETERQAPEATSREDRNAMIKRLMGDR